MPLDCLMSVHESRPSNARAIREVAKSWRVTLERRASLAPHATCRRTRCEGGKLQQLSKLRWSPWESVGICKLAHGIGEPEPIEQLAWHMGCSSSAHEHASNHQVSSIGCFGDVSPRGLHPLA